MYEEMMDDNQPGAQQQQQPGKQVEGPSQTPASESSKPNPRSIGIIFVASFIELIAAGRACTEINDCKGSYAFAVTVGSVSMFISLLFLIYGLITTPNSTALQIVGVFLMIWWTFGAGFNTFDHPFKTTSNGYFATWAAFASSVYFCYSFVPRFADLIDRAKERSQKASHGELVVLVLFISSLVELLEALLLCNDRGSCTGQNGWAVAIGSISAFFSGIVLIPACSRAMDKFIVPVALLVALLWIPGAGVLTFNAPFLATGNGYFATWVCFGCAIYWFYVQVMTKHPELKDNLKQKAQQKFSKNKDAPPV